MILSSGLCLKAVNELISLWLRSCPNWTWWSTLKENSIKKPIFWYLFHQCTVPQCFYVSNPVFKKSKKHHTVTLFLKVLYLENLIVDMQNILGLYQLGTQTVNQCGIDVELTSVPSSERTNEINTKIYSRFWVVFSFNDPSFVTVLTIICTSKRFRSLLQRHLALRTKKEFQMEFDSRVPNLYVMSRQPTIMNTPPTHFGLPLMHCE